MMCWHVAVSVMLFQPVENRVVLSGQPLPAAMPERHRQMRWTLAASSSPPTLRATIVSVQM